MIPLGNLISFSDYNGSVLAAGKLYVYNLGRNGLATVYGDVNGAVVLPNPVTLDNLGMCDIWLSPVFDYTIIITDAYGQEMFSRDIYPQRPGSGESIGTQLYEGIDPIVVNNDVYAISANTSRLGVVEPLYFVKDDEEETIIGFSGEAIIPSGTMNESAFNYQDGKITAYNGSAFSAGNEYEAGNYISIDNNTINVTGLQPSGDYQSAGNYVSASELENLQPKGDYYSASNPSGFLIDEDITGKLDTTAFSTVSGDFLTAIPSEYVTEDTLQSGLSSKLDSTAFSTVSGNFLTAHQSLEGYATEQWVENKGYITGIDIQESANWNEATTVVNNNSAIWNNTTNVVSSNSASWGASNPQIPVTGINGIKISESGDKVVFEVSGDYATVEYVESATSVIPTIGTAEYDGEFTTVHTINNLPIWSNYSNWADTAARANEAKWDSTNRAISALPDSATVNSMISSSITGKADTSALTAYAKNWQLGELEDVVDTKLDSTAFSTVSGTFLTAHQSLEGYATEDWVIAQGYLTAETDWTNTITAASANAYEQATAAIPAPFDPTYLSGQIESKLDSATYAADSGNFLTSLPSDLVYTADIQNMATTAQVSEKLDTTAFSTVSGNFLTSVDLTPYQTTAGMTAYQPAGDYLTTADSAQFYTTDNPSGFITGVDLSNYATTAQVSEKLDSTAFSTVSGNFLTAHQSLGGLMSADLLEFSGSVITAYSGYKLAGEISGDAGDAEVNALVHSNSGTWETVTDKLDTTAFSTVSGDFYTTANESGFITGVPAGTMNESNFGYDASDNITGYNGSAFKAGDEFPQSATEAIEVVTANSANWNDTTETVSSNSAAWGGEPLPLSSRDGIDLEIDNNVLWIGASALSSIYQPITGMTAYQTVLTLETGSI